MLAENTTNKCANYRKPVDLLVDFVIINAQTERERERETERARESVYASTLYNEYLNLTNIPCPELKLRIRRVLIYALFSELCFNHVAY